MASGYEMNAIPGPPLITELMSSVPNSCAKWPNIPKIVTPASKDVNVSSVVTIVASRYTLWLNLLNDEYIMMLPKPTAKEKKHCTTAAYQTYTSNEKLYVHYR